MGDDSYRMPITWSLAARGSFGLPLLPGELELTGRLSKAIDSRPDVGIGLEHRPFGWLALRGGFRPLHDSESFSLGLGLRAGGWSLDYALVPYGSGLGTTHRFSLARSV